MRASASGAEYQSVRPSLRKGSIAGGKASSFRTVFAAHPEASANCVSESWRTDSLCVVDDTLSSSNFRSP